MNKEYPMEILKQSSSNLNDHHKRSKWHLLCCCHDNTFAASPFFPQLKLKFPVLVLTKDHTPANLMMRAKTINYGNHVCSKQDLSPTYKGLKMTIFVSDKKRLESRAYSWQCWHYRYHYVVFFCDPHDEHKNLNISKTKKRYPKQEKAILL